MFIPEFLIRELKMRAEKSLMLEGNKDVPVAPEDLLVLIETVTELDHVAARNDELERDIQDLQCEVESLEWEIKELEFERDAEVESAGGKPGGFQQ